MQSTTFHAAYSLIPGADAKALVLKGLRVSTDSTKISFEIKKDHSKYDYKTLPCFIKNRVTGLITIKRPF